MHSYGEIKSVSTSGAGGFEGYASTWFNIDEVGDVFLPGAFLKALPKFLKENFVGGSMHDYSKPLGRYTDAREDAHGLYVKAEFSDIEAAREMRTLLRDKVIQKLSVGIRNEGLEAESVSAAELQAVWKDASYEPTEQDKSRLKRFRTFRLIKTAPIFEISPVAVPANSNATITTVKASDECPPALKVFARRAVQSARQIAGVDLKAGRVLSSKNERTLRAMLEVLASVTDEINNLLSLVSSMPETEDDPDAANEPDPDDPNEAAEDEEEKSSQKSANLDNIEAVKLALLMEIA